MANSQDLNWVDELTEQLLVEQGCKVAEFETMHQGELGDQNTYIATAVCSDGRRFDASRIGDKDEFSIDLCAVVQC